MFDIECARRLMQVNIQAHATEPAFIAEHAQNLEDSLWAACDEIATLYENISNVHDELAELRHAIDNVLGGSNST